MASKTTGTKKNAKQSTAKKRQPTKKTSAKSAKSAKTTRKNTTSKAVPQEESFLATEILIWVTLAVGILLTISNFGLAGAFGRKIAALQQGMMGWMAYVFPLLLFCGVAFVVSNKGNRIAYIKTIAGVVLLVQCCVLFELIDEKGGSVGKAIAVRLVPAIGKVGTYVVVIILMVICVVLITEKSILKGMKIGGEKAYDRAREDMQKRKEEAEERRARREAMRVDYQVSGVSFNSTVGGKENEAEKAEEKAIKVFGENAKQLLLGAPIKNKTVMGFDPAYRTGCKIAVIDETGKLLATTTVYPTEPQNDVEGAKKELIALIKEYNVNIIAIGNGTASRESENFVSDMIKELSNVHYAIVSEAGASVYSASKLATEEYPDINVSLRGAISIARRLQDPLAELVKIDPKSIGVGQYQHDVDQKKLSESLTGVVEDAVNKVGVDVNTATPSLLSYVSGINKTLASNIVKYRDENGKIKERKELLKVPKLGKATFQQCAGFMRVFDGKNPLEITAVHPESYEVAEQLLNIIGFKKEDLLNKEKLIIIKNKLSEIKTQETAEELNVGEITLKDIMQELSKPGRDPREDMPKPVLRADVLKFEDLKEGMILTGTVRNVTDFGAFVDVGVKHDGLVHISQLSNSFVKNPSDVVSVGDVVKVKIIGIDEDRKKAQLSMKI